jgi:hypothetical protein
MTVYQCEACGFKTDDLKFMELHEELTDHTGLVENKQ